MSKKSRAFVPVSTRRVVADEKMDTFFRARVKVIIEKRIELGFSHKDLAQKAGIGESVCKHVEGNMIQTPSLFDQMELALGIQ
jgi:ribosome-binding protein aMBF1 (putative translation factor)